MRSFLKWIIYLYIFNSFIITFLVTFENVYWGIRASLLYAIAGFQNSIYHDFYKIMYMWLNLTFCIWLIVQSKVLKNWGRWNWYFTQGPSSSMLVVLGFELTYQSVPLKNWATIAMWILCINTNVQCDMHWHGFKMIMRHLFCC